MTIPWKNVTPEQKANIIEWIKKLPEDISDLIKGITFISDTSHHPILGDKIIAGFDPETGIISLTDKSFGADHFYHEVAHAILGNYVKQENFSVIQNFSDKFEIKGESLSGYPTIYQGLADLKTRFEDIRADHPEWDTLMIESYMYNEDEGYHNYVEAFCDRFSDYVIGKGNTEYNKFFSKLFKKDYPQSIAQSLNVIYNGPQYRGDGTLAFYTFTDPITGSTFGAVDLDSAKKALEELRNRFKAQTKEPWQMTKSEYDSIYAGTATAAFYPHRKVILIAIKEGKPVPTEVLKDYPDLMLQTKSLSEKEYIQEIKKLREKYPYPQYSADDLHKMMQERGIAEPEENEEELEMEEETSTVDINQWWDDNYFETSESGEKIPCVIRTDSALDAAVEHLGYRSKSITSEVLERAKGTVRTDVDLLQESQERLKGVKIVPDNLLDYKQRTHLELARALCKEVCGSGLNGVYAADIPPASDRTRTAGLYSRTSKNIYISLDQLESAKATVDTALHESGHDTSQRDDGDPGHKIEIGRLSDIIVQSVHSGKYDSQIREQGFNW